MQHCIKPLFFSQAEAPYLRMRNIILFLKESDSVPEVIVFKFVVCMEINVFEFYSHQTTTILEPVESNLFDLMTGMNRIPS